MDHKTGKKVVVGIHRTGKKALVGVHRTNKKTVIGVHRTGKNDLSRFNHRIGYKAVVIFDNAHRVG